MPPLPLLERMLTGRGFTVIERHRAEAHRARRPHRGHLPGREPPGAAGRRPVARPVDAGPAGRRRTAALTAAVPVLAAAAATDQLLGALLAERVPLSNAYPHLRRGAGGVMDDGLCRLWSFLSAEIRPGGHPGAGRLDVSASSSRRRLIVNCISWGDERRQDQQRGARGSRAPRRGPLMSLLSRTVGSRRPSTSSAAHIGDSAIGRPW